MVVNFEEDGALHSLFDIALLSIDPANMQIVLSERLSETHYGELAGRRISLPANFPFHSKPGSLKPTPDFGQTSRQLCRNRWKKLAFLKS